VSVKSGKLNLHATRERDQHIAAGMGRLLPQPPDNLS
jgi:hypothetical protein